MTHRLVVAAAATLLFCGAAGAGGVDRSGQNIAPLFEAGRYVEFSFGSVNPSVSGVGAGTIPSPLQPTPGAASGDMTGGFGLFSTAFKLPVTDGIDVAFILDQPFGADVSYPAGTGYFAAGSVATMRSTAMTGIVRYKMPNSLSLHGGVRLQNFRAAAFVPFVTAAPGPGVVAPGAPYDGTASNDRGVGYLLGAAYERPDIALRVALTYNSRVAHDLPTSESTALGTSTSTTSIETPQSVNLDFQTGIAPDTLLFGGVRWVDWSAFEIAPQDYARLTGGAALVSYDDDTVTYTLGLGRRFSDTWSAAATVSHEPATGGFSSNLGPTDGRTSVGLAATYTQGMMELTTGLRYVWIGDTRTRVTAGTTVPASNFTDNSAVAFGLKVGFNF